MSLAHQVFVSHATEDLDTAQRVCKVLEADGISCWLATRDVKAGKDYAAAILDAIQNSQLVLLVFSGHANTSPYVLREIERAIAYGRPVLSLRIDNAIPSASMEYYLNLWQWLDVAIGVEKKRREVVAAVRGQLDRVLHAATSPNEQSEADTRPQAISSHKRPRRTWVMLAAAAVLIAAAAAGGTWVAMHHRSGAQASSSSLATTAAGNTTSSNGPARKHNTWTDLSPSGELPPARSYHSMVYAPSSGRVIMFGGKGKVSVLADLFNDIWAYDPTANTWTNLNPTGALPLARIGQSMVYDPSTLRVIMFGGQYSDAAFVAGFLGDTWAYDPNANTWTDLNPTGELPITRMGQSMVYDPSTHRVIMFGGTPSDMFATQPSDPGYFNDTWAYDPGANTWTNLNPTGTLPSARIFPSMVYDPSSRRAIVFGGRGDSGLLNDTWAYDPAANTWAELSPVGTPQYARWGAAMVYDPSGGLEVMFGGLTGNALNDIWAYDPAANAWTELAPSGPVPAGRFAPMVYDQASGRAIVFGGRGDSGLLNDTWSYTP
jgi:N-acetylneuraminic acid mutarotase